MSEVIKVYEVELELTDGSAEVVYYTHRCRPYPKSYKDNHNMFLKDREMKVIKRLIRPGHIKLRAWTLQELFIPELHEILRAAAVREITEMQTQLTRMYDRLQPITRDLPPKERPMGFREA